MGHYFDWKPCFSDSGENVYSTRFHRWARPFRVTTFTVFYRTLPAKIARTGTQAECFPCAAKKNAPLKVGNCRFHICIRGKVNQDCPMICVQDRAHLLRRWCKGRTDQALAIAVASELAF
jgi:hypothetical protein